MPEGFAARCALLPASLGRATDGCAPEGSAERRYMKRDADAVQFLSAFDKYGLLIGWDCKLDCRCDVVGAKGGNFWLNMIMYYEQNLGK